MMGSPSDKERAEAAIRDANRWVSIAGTWQSRYEKALVRIDQLEQIILKLKACYKWDRNEYQSNPALVAEVEKAMEGIRMRGENI